MRLDSAVQKVKNWFGPNSPFFHGDDARRDEPEYDPYVQPQQAYAQPQPQQYAQPQQAYAQPQPQQYAQPQQAYAQPQPQQYAQPQQAYAQPQQPPQSPGWNQQTVQEPYVQPRNRRTEQVKHDDNVVPFPQQQQPETSARVISTRIVNLRSIDDCRNVITYLRDGDCVVVVMDTIADQAEIRRYVYTLTGACFSLASTITRLSGRFGAYLLTPEGAPVFVDQTTFQMNQQMRAPARPRPYAQPQQGYAQPQVQPQPQGYAQPQVQPQPTFYPQQTPPAQPMEFSQQQFSGGYVPDADVEYAEGQS